MNANENDSITMHFFDTFGYNSIKDFVLSTFTLKLMPLTIPFAAISGIVEVIFGLKLLTITAFVLIMIVELISGMWLSIWVRKEKFSRRKFSRFGLKAFVWFSILFLLNQFTSEAAAKDMSVLAVYEYLHTTFITYVSIEYALGATTNLAKVMGKESDPFYKKIMRILSSKFEDKNEQNK